MQGCALIGLINILCALWMSHFCNANKREMFHKKNRSREGSTSGPKNITKNRLSLAPWTPLWKIFWIVPHKY